MGSMFAWDHVLASAEQEDIGGDENKDNGNSEEDDNQQKIRPLGMVVRINGRDGLCHFR